MMAMIIPKLVKEYGGTLAMMLAVGWIVFLIGLDLFGAVLDGWIFGAAEFVPAPPQVPGPPPLPGERCVTMPDGLVVCDAPGAGK